MTAELDTAVKAAVKLLRYFSSPLDKPADLFRSGAFDGIT
jgi:hypothetical protein